MTVVTEDNSGEQRSGTKNFNFLLDPAPVPDIFSCSKLRRRPVDTLRLETSYDDESRDLATLLGNSWDSPPASFYILHAVRSPTSAAVHGSATKRDEAKLYFLENERRLFPSTTTQF